MSRDEEGAMFVEYGMLVGLIAIALVITVKAFAVNIEDMFNNIGTEVAKIAPAAGP
jgi:pilus assembly protein Flp/PilA